MTFLPIVERELRVAARKKGTHWLWFFTALAAMIAVFIIMLASVQSASPQSLGRWVFNTVSGMAFAFSLLAGVFLTSDCLCSEKRDGTLGLLFLTDLKGYDMVLGKLVATSIVSVYALLAIIPMLGLPLVMGGVSVAEFGRMTLVLLAALFLSLATGMFASAMCRETRTAMIGSFAVMLGLTGGLFGVGWVLFRIFRWKAIEYLMLPSPVGAYAFSYDSEYGRGLGAVQFWVSLGLVCALGLAQLVAASLLLPRAWQADGVEVGPRREHVRVRRSVGDSNPFRWLLERDVLLGPVTKIIVGLLFLTWFCFLVSTFLVTRSDQEEMLLAAFAAAFALHLIAKGLLALQATRRFSEDRRSGALELLLTTPIEVGTILDAQRAVLKRQFRWFQTALLGVNLALIATIVLVMGRRWDDMEPVIVLSIFCAGGMALWVVDARALAWLGMSMGLRGRRHLRAVLNTMGRLLVPSWLGLLLLFAMLAAGPSSGSKVFAIWLIWFVFSIIYAGVIGISHENKLRRGFRLLAAGDQPHTDLDAPQPWSPEWESPKAESTPPAA